MTMRTKSVPTHELLSDARQAIAINKRATERLNRIIDEYLSAEHAIVDYTKERKVRRDT